MNVFSTYFDANVQVHEQFYQRMTELCVIAAHCDSQMNMTIGTHFIYFQHNKVFFPSCIEICIQTVTNSTGGWKIQGQQC